MKIFLLNFAFWPICKILRYTVRLGSAIPCLSEVTLPALLLGLATRLVDLERVRESRAAANTSAEVRVGTGLPTSNLRVEEKEREGGEGVLKAMLSIIPITVSKNSCCINLVNKFSSLFNNMLISLRVWFTAWPRPYHLTQ